MKKYVKRDSRLWRKMFQPIVDHVRAAQNGDEENERMLALRAVCNRTPPVVSADFQDFAPRVLLGNYFEYLRRLKSDQRNREKHREKLAKRGIPPEQWFLYPYLSPDERRRQREKLLVIKNFVRRGEPIPWDKLRRS